MEKLFLLSPNFRDDKISPSGQLYYCPHCAMIEGILHYYPFIRGKIEIIYVNFPRPRKQIVDLIGEENQGCPVLVVDDKDFNVVDTSYFKNKGDLKYINSSSLIARYLSERFDVGLPHP